MFVISPGCSVSSVCCLGQEKEEAVSEAFSVPYYHNGPSFTGQKTRVCVLAAAKYIHPNDLLRDKVHDQRLSLQTHWARTP